MIKYEWKSLNIVAEYSDYRSAFKLRIDIETIFELRATTINCH